jgi:hypothetical protein
MAMTSKNSLVWSGHLIAIFPKIAVACIRQDIISFQSHQTQNCSTLASAVPYLRKAQKEDNWISDPGVRRDLPQVEDRKHRSQECKKRRQHICCSPVGSTLEALLTQLVPALRAMTAAMPGISLLTKRVGPSSASLGWSTPYQRNGEVGSGNCRQSIIGPLVRRGIVSCAKNAECELLESRHCHIQQSYLGAVLVGRKSRGTHLLVGLQRWTRDCTMPCVLSMTQLTQKHRLQMENGRAI